MVLQIYRDFVKRGSEPAYRALEEDASRICARLGCPHPHFAVRPYWGMPASEWMEADPEFWNVNPVSGIRTPGAR